MVLIFTGKSICRICNKVLESEQEISGFSAFVGNTNDPIIFFNDAGFHDQCLLEHPLGAKAIRLWDQLIFKTRPINRICWVEGNTIENPDDYIFIPLLTSDENEPLYWFNFLSFDKRNLKYWQQKNEFINLAKIFQNEGKWGSGSRFNYLVKLISDMEGN